MSALVTYWTIIIESYAQRKIQEQFWHIFKQIDTRFHRHKNLLMKSYFLKFFEFLVVFSIIQVALDNYFTMFHNHIVCYLFAYVVLVKMYQFRVFYYLFYIEIINSELKVIEKGIKFISKISRSYCPWLSSDKYPVNSVKCLREYFRLIYELSVCINSVFGLSQFATILCCFYFVLTDLNWAYSYIGDMTYAYIQGFFFFIYFELLFMVTYFK